MDSFECAAKITEKLQLVFIFRLILQEPESSTFVTVLHL